MNLEKLNDLSTVSIEKELMKNLKLKRLLSGFAKEKVGKINLI